MTMVVLGSKPASSTGFRTPRPLVAPTLRSGRYILPGPRRSKSLDSVSNSRGPIVIAEHLSARQIIPRRISPRACHT